MSVRYIAGIFAGTEISIEDAKAIDFDSTIYGNWPRNCTIFGKWLFKVDDYDGDSYLPMDDILLRKSDASAIYSKWKKHFPDRDLPQVKKFFIYLID